MAKRSKRRTSRHERDRAGCISGIMNVFQFRYGRPTKRLHVVKKQVVDPGNSSNDTISQSPSEKCESLMEPDSELCKQIQNFEDARLCKDQQDKPKLVNLQPGEFISRKNRNLFRRRTKSLESYPLAENNEDCQSPSKIVILKPGPVGSKSPGTNTKDISDNMLHNERYTMHFSFTEIKRKLRRAMGKESRGVPRTKFSPEPSNGNNVDKLGENFGWGSPNRNHFYIERFTLTSPKSEKGEPFSKLKDEGPEKIRNRGSNIYIEAKKHLSEMVKSGDVNMESTAATNSVKPLGRILSLPEYNNSSHCLTPRKPGDDFFFTARMRLSPHGNVKVNPSLKMQNSKSQRSNENVNRPVGDAQEYSFEIQCFDEDTIVSEVDSKVVDVSFESSSPKSELLSDAHEPMVQHGPVTNAYVGWIDPHLSENDQVISPSHDRSSTGIEDSDCSIDKIERPSPISVLEPLFTEDDISPASNITQPVEKEIQPRHIHFEEEQSSSCVQGICTKISLDGEESAFEYVEAVLLGSGLDWDEFLLRWISFHEILDASLFEEVELFSSRPRHDQKLLFDCANEALNEVFEFHFGRFANNTRPVPKGMDLIYEVWKRVERILSQNVRSDSLDRFVKRDLAGSKKNRMNFLSDVEFIVFDTEEMIFDELVIEIVMGVIEMIISDCDFIDS